MGRLDGKVAIVTGASVGIGEAAALLFAREGAKVVVIARTGSKAQLVVDQIHEEGFEAIAVAADVGKAEDWEKIIDATIKAYGKINILVNNAGICYMESTVELCTEEHWVNTMDTNAKGTWYGIRAVVPYMRKVGGGSIINCSSIAGIVGGKASGNSIAYSASKGAIRTLSKDAAIQLAPDNIRVNSVHPGSVYTYAAEAYGLPNREAMGEVYKNEIPLPPHVGEPMDIAYAYLYLASDEAKFVTGIEMAVDGGWLAQ